MGGGYIPSGMTIYINHVPTTASNYDVIRAIANVLHNDPFKRKFCKHLNRPLNFRVILEPDSTPSSIRNSGRGTLIIPSMKLGRHFMEFITANNLKIRVEGRVLRFSIAPSVPDVEIVKVLNLVPFQDPNLAEMKENLLKQLIYQIPILKLQLGVFVSNPDDPAVIQFSIEWEQIYKDRGDARLAFEFEHKLLRLRISDITDIMVQTVVLRFVNIRRIYTGWDAGSPYILFKLTSPPDFEEEEKYRTLTGRERQDTKNIHNRLRYLDEPHANIAPYVHQVRLVLKSEDDLSIFQDMCNKAELSKPISVLPQYMNVSNRALYSSRHLDRLNKWLEKQPYLIAFQCEALIRNLLLNPLEFFDILPRIEKLIRETPSASETQQILLHFRTVLKLSHNRSHPSKETVPDALERAVAEFGRLRSCPRHRNDNAYFNAHRVTFTPTAVRFEGPYTHQSNRVIRKYAGFEDHFIRVDFRDEDGLHYRWSRETNGDQFVQERVGPILLHGFKIAGREFKFLGYSQSQLRSHSVFAFSAFVSPDPSRGIVTADSIRLELGIFKDTISYPALYAARVSQAFSATEDSVILLRHQWEEIPDIVRNGRIFTDGVGTISPQLARLIWEIMCTRRKIQNTSPFFPFAFQIRFGGYKGMVAVDQRLEGRGIYMVLRESMRKFQTWEDESIPIEIARFFHYPGVMYLNRPFIQILEDLGIHRRVFLDLQTAAVASVQTARDSLSNFAALLDSHGLGKCFALPYVARTVEKLVSEATLKLKAKECESLQSITSTFLEDPYQNFLPFFPVIINTAIHSVLRDIKHNARIPVPMSWNLVGIADETGLLKEHQVYVCIWEYNTDEVTFLQGPVLISRSPMIHPGDVRMVTAIGRPPAGSVYEKSLMPNVIIFSCQGTSLFILLLLYFILESRILVLTLSRAFLGKRDLPSCLSGGDLDGDLYVVSKYEQLHIPENNIHIPGDYPSAKRKKNEFDRPSTINDVADFVVEYINSDVVGLLSTNHLILSDQSSLGTRDPNCLELARLCSLAVDYPKSGQPVDIQRMPRFLIPYKPDWKSDEDINPSKMDYYESSRAIGHLFRAIRLEDCNDSLPNRNTSGVSLGSAASLVTLRDSFNRSPRNITPISSSPGSATPNTSVCSFGSTTLVTGSLSRTTTPQSSRPLATDLFSTALESEVLRHLQILSTPIPFDFSDPTDTDYELYNIPPLFHRYAMELKCICVTHTLSYDIDACLREEEVVIGTILGKSKERKWRRDRIEEMRIRASQLVYMVLYELHGGNSFDAITDGKIRTLVGITLETGPTRNSPTFLGQHLLRAWMAWKYACTHTKLYGNKSFSLLALQVIFKKIEELETLAEKKLSG
ncbi:hypothetical protein Clacol_006784 [Clathrus columnatus]|uniref:RNA-dependent RNA polymerase n=1 Tax=Clathrus columnatus TaxID=1419009 RepID=A0AAV5AD19_9AGAM|nr:hypothetical protein Clacol_006784 [Clathrus columnatus]